MISCSIKPCSDPALDAASADVADVPCSAGVADVETCWRSLLPAVGLGLPLEPELLLVLPHVLGRLRDAVLADSIAVAVLPQLDLRWLQMW